MHTTRKQTSAVGIVVALGLGALGVACAAPSPPAAPTAVAQAPAASNPAAAKPNSATLRIVSPASGVTLGGASIKVGVDYSGPTLVPGAEAKKLEDYHLHYFLDEDATAYVADAKSIPTGNPRIVHSAAREVAFDNLAPGTHTVAVVMSGNNHVPVAPSLIDTVSFTVQ